jgi:hypothetical protein
MVTGGLLPVMYAVTGKRSRIIEYSGGMRMCQDCFDNWDPLHLSLSVVTGFLTPCLNFEFCVSSVVGDVFVSGVISGGNYMFVISPLLSTNEQVTRWTMQSRNRLLTKHLLRTALPHKG